MLPATNVCFLLTEHAVENPTMEEQVQQPIEGKKCLKSSENKLIKLCWLEATMEN
jgi:hypothetical protein